MISVLLACTTDLTPPEGVVVPGDTGVQDSEEVVDCGEPEVCDGVDNDCDGLVDEEDDSLVATWSLDADGDTFGDGQSPIASCERLQGYANRGGDCDDSDAAIHPLADEICRNGVDEDCDGLDDCRWEGALTLEDLPHVWLRETEYDGWCYGGLRSAGDVNGDGTEDLFAGCENGYYEPGVAFFFYGPLTADTTFLQADAKLRGTGNSNSVGSDFVRGDWGWLVENSASHPWIGQGPITGDHLVEEFADPFIVSWGGGYSGVVKEVSGAADAFVMGNPYDEDSSGRATWADGGEPVWWLLGEPDEQLGSYVFATDLDGDGHSDLLTSSRLHGVVGALHDPALEGEQDWTVQFPDATHLGRGEVLVVAYQSAACLYEGILEGAVERDQATACATTDEAAWLDQLMAADLDASGVPDLLLSTGHEGWWYYADPVGEVGRTPWETTARLDSEDHWVQFGPAEPFVDQDGDGLREVAFSYEQNFDGGMGDVILVSGATE